MIGGVGWYRKDFSLPEASRALAWAVRFESVNYRSRVWLNGKRVGSNRGAYIPFELRLNGLKRRGTQPARDPRRLQAPHDRLPALGPRHQRHADRRLVELLGPPARGLPQAPQRGRLEVRARDAAARLRALHRDRAGPRHPAQRAPGRPARPRHRQLRLAPHRPRHPRHPGQRGDLVQHQLQDARARACGRPRSPNLYNVNLRASAGGRGRQLVPAAHGHPLDPRLQRRPPDPQRRAREPPRRRRARGLQGPGLRGRQRVPRAARRRDQGGRRDDDAHALPDAPVHARAGRPQGRDDLVRGPGLRDQDLEPRQAPA